MGSATIAPSPLWQASERMSAVLSMDGSPTGHVADRGSARQTISKLHGLIPMRAIGP